MAKASVCFSNLSAGAVAMNVVRATMTTVTVGLAAMLAACQADVVRLEVDAGRFGRDGTPVHVELDASAGGVDGPVCLEADGEFIPAQLERSKDGQSRLWWVVNDLPAGQRRTYTLRSGSACADAGKQAFAWKDSSANGLKSTDLIVDGRRVLRYMYTPFDADDIERTKKPFHHVFSPDGSTLITQGEDGKLYPHHRGIFFGYKKTQVDDQVYDTWHAAKGEHTLHAKTLAELTGPVVGGHVVAVEWKDRQGKTFARETRRVVSYRQDKGQLLIELSTTLRPADGPVGLDGDRQHAGVQFRAASEVADRQKETRYIRPAPWTTLPADTETNTPDYKDLPWDAVQFHVGDSVYTVACLTDPSNPDHAEFSERLYGRFGEFIPWDLREDHPLELRYRWWVSSGGDAIREQIESRYRDLSDPPVVRLVP